MASKKEGTYDLIIIGGGPAGMSAALYATRQNLKFLFIAEQLGGMANNIPTIETYLGYIYLSGYELVDKYKEHLKKKKIKSIQEKVVDIKRGKNNFNVKTKLSSYQSKAIIVATGRRFKKLDIPGAEKFHNKGLSDCSACDGPLFKNKTVAVIGGGRTGLVSSMFLLNIAKKIYLIEKSPQLKTEEGVKPYADIIKAHKKVEVLTSTTPLEIKGDKFVNKIVVRQGRKKRSIDLEGVFVEVGYTPNNGFIRGLVKTNKRGEIMVGAECRTSAKGIFAAGDVTHLKEKQVIVSAGEGAKAALSAVLYLEKLAKK